jgi:hypothetical protein
MSSVVISGDTSGAITLAVPAVAGTNTITLPASTGTIITTGSPQSGSVIQVVNATYSTAVSVSNSTYVDSGLTATITPKFSTSKILVLTMMHNEIDGGNNTGGNLRLYRGATLVWDGNNAGTLYNYALSGGSLQFSTLMNIHYLDSPATTSATTYKIQGNLSTGTTHIMQWQSIQSTMILMEIAA